MLVSEIVTNAVRASAEEAHRQHTPEQAIGVPTVRFWLTSDGHRVLIQVWDSDHSTHTPQTIGLHAESGRGLLLVETHSTQWGSYTSDNRDGKIVWAMCMTDAQDSY